MKILIISPGYLAVPAINGGAIETLIDTLIDENETYKCAEIEVFGVNDGSTIDFNRKKLTKYYFINNTNISFKVKRIIYALINKIPGVYFGNSYIREVEKILRRKDVSGYDVVVIENNPKYILRVKKYFQCPIYLHLHNNYLHSNMQFSKKILNLFDGILTVSNYIGSRVKTIDKNCSKVRTLYNGIDIDRFNIEKVDECRSFRAKCGFTDDDFVFLYTGRIIPQKGVLEMIRSFNEANKKIPKIKLLIVGSTSFKNGKKTKYLKLVEKESSKNKNVVFTGFISYKDIPLIYKCCQSQIVPSLWGEALGNTVIEGCASKLPLIINNIGGMPEIVGENGALLIDEKNFHASLVENIEKIVSDNNLRETLIQEAFLRAKLFDKSNFYHNFINLLKSKKN